MKNHAPDDAATDALTSMVASLETDLYEKREEVSALQNRIATYESHMSEKDAELKKQSV